MTNTHSSIHTGILFINTGSPDAPTPKAVKAYLAEFLSDPRVIEKPRWFWLPILHGIILRTRPTASAKLYQNIWTPTGSPLIANTAALADAMTHTFQARGFSGVAAFYAMRYGEPSVEKVLDAINAQGIERLLVVPLFPQYSPHTTVSCLDAVYQYALTHRKMPELRIVNEYHDHEAYIGAVVEQMKAYWAKHESAIAKGGKLLFSYHSCPIKGRELGDVYQAQCERSTALIAEALGLPAGSWEICYQSRFGRDPWLEPIAQDLAVVRAKEGVPALDVVCPGFAQDCLETLEEIAITLARSFKAHYQGEGEPHFGYIPALNATPASVAMFEAILTPYLSGWAD